MTTPLAKITDVHRLKYVQAIWQLFMAGVIPAYMVSDNFVYVRTQNTSVAKVASSRQPASVKTYTKIGPKLECNF